MGKDLSCADASAGEASLPALLAAATGLATFAQTYGFKIPITIKKTARVTVPYTGRYGTVPYSAWWVP